jgi:16S rRNA processing protein RimM
MKKRVCLGAFAGAHGVKGEFKVKTFTETPENVAVYGPLESEDGSRRFSLRLVRILKSDLVIATAAEIESREEAAALAGTRLYVDRAVLPEADEDEFYLEDLVGLEARGEDGRRLGVVTALHNFGAGDIVEVKLDGGGPLLLPFTKETVPEIDVDAGRIVIAEAALQAENENSPADIG